jgi:hypothetical protein
MPATTPQTPGDEPTVSRRRTLFGLKKAELLALGAVLVLVAGLLLWGAHMGRAGAAGGDRIWTEAGSLVVWRTPSGMLVARLTGDGGTTEISLGQGTDVRLVAGSARPLLLITDASGGHRLVAWSARRRSWSIVLASLDPHDLGTAVVNGGLIYTPEGSGRGAAVVAVHPDGRTAARYPLPTLPPDPRAALRPDSPTGLLGARARRGDVAALLGAGRHVLAVTSTGAAAAVTDLTTGVTVTLTGYDRVYAATMGGDGLAYVLAGRADPAATLRILRVDPRSMQAVAAWDTGAGGSSEPAWALPTRFGAVFYSPGLPHSLDAYSGTNIWLVDDSGIHQNSAVSSNDGVRMGPGAGDTVLLYGPPAGGTVSRLGLDDGALSRASNARVSAPSGSTVLFAAD